MTPEIYSELTRLFLKSNSTQMPASFERGLISFFSTFEVNGIRITAGKPPAKPDLDWARIHLMVADPDYFGKIRVLLYNLRHGVAEDPAYRNAFGKPAAEVEAAGRKALRRRQFPDHLARQPSHGRRRFSRNARSPTADIALARADLLAGAQSAAEYQKLLAAQGEDSRSRRRSRTPRLAREAYRGRAQLFRGRRGGRTAPARAATSSTPSWSATATRPRKPCSRPPASTPSSTSPSP